MATAGITRSAGLRSSSMQWLKAGGLTILNPLHVSVPASSQSRGAHCEDPSPNGTPDCRKDTDASIAPRVLLRARIRTPSARSHTDLERRLLTARSAAIVLKPKTTTGRRPITRRLTGANNAYDVPAMRDGEFPCSQIAELESRVQGILRGPYTHGTIGTRQLISPNASAHAQPLDSPASARFES